MDGLRVMEDGTYLDGTFGRGGHARGVLQRLGTGGRLLLMDKDPEAIAVAEHGFGADPRVSIHRGSFTDLAHWDAVRDGLDGVLFDLGVSSPQLDVAERGFSFGKDGPLDMRMDPDAGESAAQWLARAGEAEIADVLWTFGEERMSRRIARAIVARRAEQPLTRTAQLAELIASVMPRPKAGRHEIHPATRSFQAIRIHVNRELADLEAGLDAAHAALRPGGRLAVISFHSLEDRIVKRFIARHAKAPAGNRRLPETDAFEPTLRAIGAARKGDAAEIAANPRARSAVLRVAEKLGAPGLGTRDPGLEEQRREGQQRQQGRIGVCSSRVASLFRVPSPASRVPPTTERRP
ncbi:16S rRNA (cytosine(1402)-N(4))-methyltransferase RsmH [Luteimonas lutimaris]|uniref:Ribosomal RNA small subunit methyltransferase H n=1 Tax=Luteimonas lutimaris TaxID=698645 RepID=A0ABP7N0G5_9GAMM